VSGVCGRRLGRLFLLPLGCIFLSFSVDHIPYLKFTFLGVFATGRVLLSPSGPVKAWGWTLQEQPCDQGKVGFSGLGVQGASPPRKEAGPPCHPAGYLDVREFGISGLGSWFWHCQVQAVQLGKSCHSLQSL
jgi:hypothetical protein